MNRLVFLFTLFIFLASSQASPDFDLHRTQSAHSIVNSQFSHQNSFCEADIESEADIEFDSLSPIQKKWREITSEANSLNVETLDLKSLYVLSNVSSRGPPVHS